jgi:hypothetical protein
VRAQQPGASSPKSTTSQPPPKRLPTRLEDLELAAPTAAAAQNEPTQAAPAVDIAQLNAIWPDLMRWADSAYPSLSPILSRQSYTLNGTRVVLLTSNALEGELLLQAREPLTGTIARLCGVAGIGLETAVDAALAPEPTERPLTLDEHRRRLQQTDSNFALFEQTFQTFLDP